MIDNSAKNYQSRLWLMTQQKTTGVAYDCWLSNKTTGFAYDWWLSKKTICSILTDDLKKRKNAWSNFPDSRDANR